MKATRGFSSEQAKFARQKRDVNDLNEQIRKLQKDNKKLNNVINYYRGRYTETLNELENFKKQYKNMANLSRAYPFLFNHLLGLNLDNESENAKYGNRFKPELMPIYVLLSMSGEYYTDILHKYFGFPSVRACRDLKNKFKLRYGIDENIFDGSYESISKLVRLFFNNDDKRCVLAVDAAAVNAKLTVHKDGSVDGLLSETKIDQDLVDLISSDLDAFHSFYELHRDEIVKYFFVFYLCPLHDENKSFPIFLKKKTNGAADVDITAELEELAIRCQAIGLDIVGLSFDGDQSYLKYVDEMCQEIDEMEEIDLSKPLSSLFTKYNGVSIYEDPLHLVKCDRYRLACGSDICSSLSDDFNTFNVNDLKALGIKDYILDNSKAKKMDDNLPLLLFSHENIKKALDAGRFDIVLALLPSFLLINAIFSAELTREKRIEQLTFGFSIVSTYFNDYLKYDFQGGLQRRNKNGGHNKHMTLFDPIWMKKYMSLTISLSKILIDRRHIHLGSLGTHFLEHFFGMVRRFCRGNDSSTEFLNEVENILIFKLLQKESIKEIVTQPRRSDSGARLQMEHQNIKEIPVNICMYRAAELFEKTGSLINVELNEVVNESVGNILNGEDISNYIQYMLLDKKQCFNSTAKLRYNSTAGYTSMKRMISGNTI